MPEKENPIKIMLVDDHLLFREGVSSLLKRDARFEVISEADDGNSALEMLKERLPDVVLMDVKMPEMNGIETTRKMLAAHPSLKVMMITASEKEEDLFQAVKAGAQGYILKTVTDSKYMRDAICSVAEGEAIIPAAMVPRLLNEFASLASNDLPKRTETPQKEETALKEVEEEPSTINLLTPRENEVLALVAQGMTNKEIAQTLVISVNTVRSHLRFILDKLHINNRVQAAMWYKEKRA